MSGKSKWLFIHEIDRICVRIAFAFVLKCKKLCTFYVYLAECCRWSGVCKRSAYFTHNKHSIVLMAITLIWLHSNLLIQHTHMVCNTIEHNHHEHEMLDSYICYLKIACSFSGYLFFILGSFILFSDSTSNANEKLFRISRNVVLPFVIRIFFRFHVTFMANWNHTKDLISANNWMEWIFFFFHIFFMNFRLEKIGK